MLESRYDLKVFFPSTSLISSSLLVLLEFHCALRFEYFSNFRFVSHNVLFPSVCLPLASLALSTGS